MGKKDFYKLVDYCLIGLGFFLIIERLFLHWIRFDYGTIGLAWIDPFFDHWMLGLILIVVAVWDLHQINK